MTNTWHFDNPPNTALASLSNATIALSLLVFPANNLDQTAAFYNKLGITFNRHRHGSGPEQLSVESEPPTNSQFL
jgi:hypothetical protein